MAASFCESLAGAMDRVAAYRERFCPTSEVLPLLAGELRRWGQDAEADVERAFSHVEFSHKIVDGCAHSQRIHVCFHALSGIDWTRQILQRLEEEQSGSFDYALFDQIVTQLEGERVIFTAFGVDNRSDCHDARAKFWAAISYPGDGLWEWLFSCFQPLAWLTDHTREYLLVGTDLFLDGRTRLKPYLSYTRDIPGILATAGGIHPTVLEHLEKAESLHFAVSGDDRVTMHASVPPPPFLNDDHFPQINGFYENLGMSLRLLSIPLEEARTGQITNYNLYY